MKKAFAVILCVITALSCLACTTGYYAVDGTVFSSGMVFSARISGGNERKTAQKMQDFLTEADGIFNTNIPASEISLVNAADKNERVEVSEHFYAVASLALEISAKTDSAFNCALSPVSRAWGVDIDGIARYCYGGQSVDGFPTKAELSEIRPLTSASGYAALSEDGKYYIVKSESGLTLDFGGIAKGYCTDILRQIATENGVKSGVISISGNTVLIGKKADGSSWGVGVNNPRRKSDADKQYVCGFYESDISVVTSGDYERYYEHNGVRVCHIIDGRTLFPVGVERTESGEYRNTTDYIISATVIGPSSAAADAYATAVTVLGLEKGTALLRENGYKGVIFTADGKCAIVGEIEMSQSETLYLTEYEKI